jgi:hypothetical protein
VISLYVNCPSAATSIFHPGPLCGAHQIAGKRKGEAFRIEVGKKEQRGACSGRLGMRIGKAFIEAGRGSRPWSFSFDSCPYINKEIIENT